MTGLVVMLSLLCFVLVLWNTALTILYMQQEKTIEKCTEIAQQCREILKAQNHMLDKLAGMYADLNYAISDLQHQFRNVIQKSIDAHRTIRANRVLMREIAEREKELDEREKEIFGEPDPEPQQDPDPDPAPQPEEEKEKEDETDGEATGSNS